MTTELVTTATMTTFSGMDVFKYAEIADDSPEVSQPIRMAPPPAAAISETNMDVNILTKDRTNYRSSFQRSDRGNPTA